VKDVSTARYAITDNGSWGVRVLCCVVTIIAVFIWPTGADAGLSARDRYYAAESCYQHLRENPERMAYRHNWMGCIRKFESVYQSDPNGPWAAAGLYRSGTLYLALYGKSFLPSDKQEAIDIFKRIVKRFPKSAYRVKADAELRRLKNDSPKKRTRVDAKPRTSASKRTTAGAKAKYLAADACFRKLSKDKQKQKYRHHWMGCIDQAESAYTHDPDGIWAAASLYLSGQMYEGLYQRSFQKDDEREALLRYRKILLEFPKSRYLPRARKDIARITEHAPPSRKTRPSDTPVSPADVIARESRTPHPSPSGAARDTQRPPASENLRNGAVSVTGLRFWSNPNYTRVVIDADDDTAYVHRLLKKNPSINKPQRLFVDLSNSLLGDNIERTVPINDNLLSDVRAGQHTPDSVRVVIDIKSFKTYKIFSLKNPFRVVIDVWGKSNGNGSRQAPGSAVGKGKDIPPGALAKQLALGVRRIVIDPGHGGRDYGAPGYLKGVHEKDVVLSISKHLATKLRKHLGVEVILTRTADQYLTLEERTALANTHNADLFISVHTNSHRDRRAYGVETYFLNLATDNEAIMVAAMENATSEKNISDLQTILLDLMQNVKINESSRLAVHVQDAMHRSLKKKYSRIKNKGVKQAPFYVLLGAQMPAILIETSFISNRRECKRLTDPAYQNALVLGIVRGIQKYIREISSTTIYAPAPEAGQSG